MNLKIDDAVLRFEAIQEELKRLTEEAFSIIKYHIDAKAQPSWYKQIITATNADMDNELGDLEDEAVEQEEAGLEKEIKEFGQKYPEIKLSKEIANEMQAQGFSINETKRLVIIETPYADYPFNKKTGIPLKPKV